MSHDPIFRTEDGVDVCWIKCPSLGYDCDSGSGYVCYGGRKPVGLSMCAESPRRSAQCKRRHPEAKPTNG